MADNIPTPVPPPPTAVQGFFTSLLPQFIAYSRKGMVWFTGLGSAGVLELVRSIGNAQGWNEIQTSQWNSRILFFQAAIVLVSKFWTDQIAREDTALKTGLPPPTVTIAGGNITTPAATPPAPLTPTDMGSHTNAIQGLPPKSRNS